MIKKPTFRVIIPKVGIKLGFVICGRNSQTGSVGKKSFLEAYDIKETVVFTPDNSLDWLNQQPANNYLSMHCKTKSLFIAMRCCYSECRKGREGKGIKKDENEPLLFYFYCSLDRIWSTLSSITIYAQTLLHS